MSKNIAKTDRIIITQFWGGSARGKCLQLTDISPNTDSHKYISIDKKEAQEIVEILKIWLENEEQISNKHEK